MEHLKPSQLIALLCFSGLQTKRQSTFLPVEPVNGFHMTCPETKRLQISSSLVNMAVCLSGKKSDISIHGLSFVEQNRIKKKSECLDLFRWTKKNES